MTDDIYDVSEADEQSNTPEGAMEALASQFRRFLEGKETLGVLGMFEIAAYKMGNSWPEIITLEDNIRKEK
jgi:hypothetical protein